MNPLIKYIPDKTKNILIVAFKLHYLFIMVYAQIIPGIGSASKSLELIVHNNWPPDNWPQFLEQWTIRHPYICFNFPF